MKVAEDAAQELPLNDEKLPVKKNVHVTIATRHLRQRRDALLKKRVVIDREVGELEAAISALNPGA